MEELNPWTRKIPWSRKWQLTPIFLTGKSHGQRSLVGYSPWGHKIVGHNLATKQQIHTNTVSPLHMTLQVANFQRCNCATTQISLDHFFKSVDRTESGEEPKPVRSTSGMSEIAPCPPPLLADYPSALPASSSSQ